MVIWIDSEVKSVNPVGLLESVVQDLNRSCGIKTNPLFVPCDDSMAWAWMAWPDDVAANADQFTKVLAEYEPAIALAFGTPVEGVNGFRYTHAQALSAQTVARAAGTARFAVTPFEAVAPIIMMCADLKAAREWISATLGELAVDTARNEMLRETVRTFLTENGSYTATAEALVLHRNTAQYRVRKAEELRGRPFRDHRLEVELALLACHWLGEAGLQKGPGPDHR